jgi:hypothetical protein
MERAKGVPEIAYADAENANSGKNGFSLRRASSNGEVSKNFACDSTGRNVEPLVAVGDRQQMSRITNSNINFSYLDFYPS